MCQLEEDGRFLIVQVCDVSGWVCLGFGSSILFVSC